MEHTQQDRLQYPATQDRTIMVGWIGCEEDTTRASPTGRHIYISRSCLFGPNLDIPTGLVHAIKTIVKTEGRHAMYQGLSANVFGSAAAWGSYFFG